MNIDAIRAVVRSHRREFVSKWTPAGRLDGVRLENGVYSHGRDAVWGLAPIGDESDVRFAKFLVEEAKRIEAGGTKPPPVPNFR